MNSMNDLQGKGYAFADLCCEVETGRAYLISRKERNKVYGYRQGVKCVLGDVERSEWQAMVRKRILDSGEKELHDHLAQWHKEHCYLQQSEDDFAHDVLILHSMRIFDDPLWVHFIPFNQQYRPDVLRGIAAATVCTECCGVPFLATQTRIMHDGNRRTYCSICGRWSHYEILSNGYL